MKLFKTNTGAYAPSPKHPILELSNPESIKEWYTSFTEDYEHLSIALLWTRFWLIIATLVCMALVAILGGTGYLMHTHQIVILQILKV